MARIERALATAPERAAFAPPRWRDLAVVVLTLLATIASAPADAADGDIRVRYRSADTVYLDAGEAAGLQVGDRLEVRRGGRVIGEIEVTYTASRSASCRVVSESPAIAAGDVARRDHGAEGVAQPAPAEPAPEEPAATAPASSAEAPQWPARAAAELTPTEPARRPPSMRLSGTFSLDFNDFTDESGYGLDSRRATASLNLRARDIGGGPYELRVRMRRRDERRARLLASSIPANETLDRLYELSLSYEPVGGRFSWSVGRLGVAPFVGLGFLDGALGQAALGRHFDLGAFYGSRPALDGVSFDTARAKYGVFTRLRPERSASWLPWEVIVAGIREEGRNDISREYAVLESRYDRGRFWSLYERAEVDVNSGWRKEEAGRSSQLSNLSLATTLRFNDATRFVLSYDRFENYRTEETRDIPLDLFDDRVRQALRGSLYVGRSGGLRFSLDAGVQKREGDSDTTTYAGLGIDRYGLGAAAFSFGGNAQFFSNPYTDGVQLSLRAGKQFRGGHRIDLALGDRESNGRLLDRQRTTFRWVRLSGWAELPRRLFARAEVEVDSGDETQGRWLSAGLGYRF